MIYIFEIFFSKKKWMQMKMNNNMKIKKNNNNQKKKILSGEKSIEQHVFEISVKILSNDRIIFISIPVNIEDGNFAVIIVHFSVHIVQLSQIRFGNSFLLTTITFIHTLNASFDFNIEMNERFVVLNYWLGQHIPEHVINRNQFQWKDASFD